MLRLKKTHFFFYFNFVILLVRFFRIVEKCENSIRFFIYVQWARKHTSSTFIFTCVVDLRCKTLVRTPVNQFEKSPIWNDKIRTSVLLVVVFLCMFMSKYPYRLQIYKIHTIIILMFVLFGLSSLVTCKHFYALI